MRRLFLLLALALVAGCDSQEPDTPAAGLSATVDGRAFRPTTASALRVDDGDPERTHLISAARVAGSQIESLGLFVPGRVGTYSGVDDGALATYAILRNADVEQGWAAPGVDGGALSVRVTSVSDGRIAGTFAFTGVSEDGGADVEVTDGRFDLPVEAVPAAR